MRQVPAIAIKGEPNAVQGELNRIPWLDFTKERRDADLRVEWNIGDDLWHFIDNKIPDYYTDYKYERKDQNG